MIIKRNVFDAGWGDVMEHINKFKNEIELNWPSKNWPSNLISITEFKGWITVWYWADED